MSFEISVVSSTPIGFGEGPHWDAGRKLLYYVDAFDKSLTTLDFNVAPIPAQSAHKFDLDNNYVSIATPVANSDDEFLVVAHKRIGIYSTNASSLLATLQESPGRHYNDAKCDSAGRLWVGEYTSVEPPPPPEATWWEKAGIRFGGHLCSLDRGKFQRHSGGHTAPNGICFSPDERIVYSVDSAENKIFAQEYDIVSGIIKSEKSVAFELHPNTLGYDGKAVLDGIAVDVKGNLWTAVYLAGTVINIDSQTGKMLNSISFPVPLMTSLCFGGDTLSDMYVTSCYSTLPNLSDHVTPVPESGHTFRVRCDADNGFKGTPMYSYSK